jgi:hypothetical protein
MGFGYGIPKWTYLETIIVWTLRKFCLTQGSTLRHILMHIHFIIRK